MGRRGDDKPGSGRGSLTDKSILRRNYAASHRVAELEANLRESQTVMERALNLAVEYPRKFDLAGMDPFRKASERNRVVLENRCKLSYSERRIRELEAAVVLRNKGE